MGLLDRFGLGRDRLDFLASPSIASPWSSSEGLSTAVIGDLFGAEVAASLPLTRSDAIRVPAVSKARNLLISALAPAPLMCLDKSGELAVQPSFLYRSDTDVSPYERMAWTIDSLIFYGVALWAVRRGTNGQILDAAWVPHDRWTIRDGVVLVDHQPVDASEVILFNSPFEGLLNIAATTLRGARDIEASWVSKVRNPIPLTVIRSTAAAGNGLTQAEITDLLSQWAAARRSEDGALGYLPPELELDTHGEVDPALLLEGRNAIRNDIAAFLNIPASMLDGSLAEASLTYVTTEGNRNRFYEESIPFWADPIQHRLSLNDVVPRGQRVRFNFADKFGPTPSPTGPVTED